MRYVRSKQPPRSKTCALHALHTATGKSLRWLRERMRPNYLRLHIQPQGCNQTRDLDVLKEVFWQGYSQYTRLLPGVPMVLRGVNSLNNIGGSHMIFWDGLRIIDPSPHRSYRSRFMATREAHWQDDLERRRWLGRTGKPGGNRNAGDGKHFYAFVIPNQRFRDTPEHRKFRESQCPREEAAAVTAKFRRMQARLTGYRSPYWDGYDSFAAAIRARQERERNIIRLRLEEASSKVSWGEADVRLAT